MPRASAVSDAQACSQPFRSIRYLGNKRKLLSAVVSAIDALDVDGLVLDLFGGTNVVAGALAPRFRVATNDLQKFSWVLGKALLGSPGLTRTRTEAEQDLAEAYHENYATLQRWCDRALESEASFLESTDMSANWANYSAFCESYPHFPLTPVHLNNGFDADFLRPFSTSYVLRRRRDPSTEPYTLFSTYFANAYFGLRQSLQIDSLRYAIDRLKEDVAVRYVYLAALIYAASASVSAVGHFAQYRKPHSRDACSDLVFERNKDIWVLFQDFVDEVFAKPRIAIEGGKNYNSDYRRLLYRMLRGPPVERPVVVYADPPYFRDHYSRFYHVLETLVRYDYPDSSQIGRYRHDRSASGFSMKSKAQTEFRRLAFLCRELGADLIVSYCSNATLPISNVKSLLAESYPTVLSESIDYSHSTQGRSLGEGENGLRARTEYLLTCRGRRLNRGHVWTKLRSE